MTDETIASRIRHDIADGHFSPSQRLVETELADRYGVGRAGVRDAIIALERERLLEREPNKGARVRPIPLDEAIEIVEARSILESFCAAKAAARITSDEADELHGLVGATAEAVRTADIIGYSALNERLHRRVNELAGHATTLRLLENLHHLSVRYQFSVTLLPGRPAISLPEHRAIVEAVVAHDATGAQAAVAAHLRSVIEALKELSRKTGIGR